MSALCDPNSKQETLSIQFILSKPLLDLKQEMKVKPPSNVSNTTNTNEKPPLRELNSCIVLYI